MDIKRQNFFAGLIAWLSGKPYSSHSLKGDNLYLLNIEFSVVNNRVEFVTQSHNFLLLFGYLFQHIGHMTPHRLQSINATLESNLTWSGAMT